MAEHASRNDERAALWDSVYAARGATGVSWHQPHPRCSLDLIAALEVPADAAVVDVGGGASPLARCLLDGGFVDVSVLDISAVALAEARRALPGAPVAWLHEDVLRWRPERRFDLWHDRAVFHFFVDPGERAAYVRALRAAIGPGGGVVLAAFAPDGPALCSGLPVVRYSEEELARALGDGFECLDVRREEHVTPRGAVQPFTWVAGRIGPVASPGRDPSRAEPRATTAAPLPTQAVDDGA